MTDAEIRLLGSLLLAAARAALAERNRLAWENRGLAHATSLRLYSQHSGVRLIGSREDVFQEAMVALLDAIVKFDPSRGWTFATYAVAAMRNQILSRSGEMLLVRVPRMAQHLATSRLPTRKKQAAETRRRTLLALEGCRPLAGRRTAKWLPDSARRDGCHYEDMIPHREAERRTERELSDSLEDALAELTAPQREALEARYGLNGRPREKMKDLGARLGVSKQGANLRVRAAVRKLREKLGAA